MPWKKIIPFLTAMAGAGAIILAVWISNNSEYAHSPKQKLNYKPRTISRPHGPDIVKEPGAYPNEWMGYQRMYPHNTIRSEHYLNALAAAQHLHQRSTPSRIPISEGGPFNIGGRITDIEVDSANPETFYVGAASGGIYKTEDNGQSWENIFTDAPVISIGDLAVNPDNPEILYAGTGEANASSFSFMGNGIYKSTDGGMSWTHQGLSETAYIGRIVVDYDNPQRVWTAACGSLFSPNPHRGIYRSEDGGTTWENVLFLTDSTAAVDIVQHPTQPEILFASMWERIRGLNYRRSGGESSGIWKSTDGGDTWQELVNGLPSGDNVGRIGLTISRSNPNILYAYYDKQMEEDDNFSFLGIYKTTNGGIFWTQTNDAVLEDIGASFGWYFGQIRVDPSDEDRVFALGVDLVRTENGGNSWEHIAGYWNTDEIHVDHHAMVIDADSGQLLIGNDGGLYVSEDYGDSFVHINNIPLTQFYTIETDPQQPHRIYGGTQDNGTIRTLSGEPDDWHRILGGDGFYTLVDPNNSNLIYAEYQWGNLYRSDNGGSDFFNISDEMNQDRTNWSSPLAMDPSSSNTLYFGTYRIWKSMNFGSSWIPVSADLTLGDDGSGYHTLTTIAVSTLNPDIIITGSDDGRISLSQNGGSDWDFIDDDLPLRWVTRVAADLVDVNTLYCTFSGFRWDEPMPHVFRSADLGQTWVSISGNLPELPVNAFAQDPQIPDRLFVGTDAGLYQTHNGGESWGPVSEDLPNVAVTGLKFIPDTRELVVGTYGCSSYRLDMQFLPGDINGDLTINIQDIILIINFIMGTLDPTDEQFAASDFNNDGSINVLDITAIVQAILAQ